MTEVIFLLGAGASVACGMPVANQLYESLLNDLKSTNISWYDLILNLQKINPNFEKGISSLEFFSKKMWDKDEIKLIEYFENKELSSLTSSKIDDIYDLLDYIKRVWIDKVFNINNHNKVKFLKPFFKKLSKIDLHIFTLNYDNSLELCCLKNNVPFIDGFTDPNEMDVKFFNINTYSQNKRVKIYKLHGSVNCFIPQTQSNGIYNLVAKYPIDYVHTLDRKFEQRLNKPAIILGSNSKLTHEGYYLDLLQEFRIKLMQSKHIYIIGYSFQDKHINKYILESWNTKQNQKYYIIDPYIPYPSSSQTPAYLGGAYSVDGSYDYRNIFFNQRIGNELSLVPLTFQEFIKRIKNNQAITEGLCFKSNILI